MNLVDKAYNELRKSSQFRRLSLDLQGEVCMGLVDSKIGRALLEMADGSRKQFGEIVVEKVRDGVYRIPTLLVGPPSFGLAEIIRELVGGHE